MAIAFKTAGRNHSAGIVPTAVGDIHLHFDHYLLGPVDSARRFCGVLKGKIYK